jgi:cytochrome c
MKNRLLMTISMLGFAAVTAAWGQTPGQGLGRTPSAEEVKSWMHSVGPTGKELLPGQGTPKEGEALYNQRCIFCHGPGGQNGPFNALKGEPRLPFATSMWDYIHRAMPRDPANPGVQAMQLTPDEVYALCAYILHLNSIIGPDEVMNEKTLPKVQIPIKPREHD